VTAVWILLALCALALVFVLAVAWKLSTMVVRPRLWDYDKSFDEEIKHGAFTKEQFANELPHEELYIDSPFGYKLHAMVFPAKEGAAFPDGRARVAVMAHGYTYTLYGGVKYVRVFRELGFACILYDERNHGKSGRAPTSMGYYEAQDLSAVCTWARARFGEDCVLGTHGESMGAAIVMMHAPTDERLAFAVEDCGYCGLRDEVTHELKALLHLPPWPIVPLANVFVKLRGGVDFDKVRSAGAVARCREDLPMLFIHGAKDNFVPFWMLDVNYSAKRGAKEKAVFPEAAHAESWFKYPEQYAKTVEAFLKKYNVI
jgi:fermentation-respiration switch protein FrsA (DUF1100 family)